MWHIVHSSPPPLSSFPIFPSRCPSIPWVWLTECTGVKPMCMVALNSTTLLSTGILVYSARRFGYSRLTFLVKNQFSLRQPCLLACFSDLCQWCRSSDTDLKDVLASPPDWVFLLVAVICKKSEGKCSRIPGMNVSKSDQQSFPSGDWIWMSRNCSRRQATVRVVGVLVLSH